MITAADVTTWQTEGWDLACDAHRQVLMDRLLEAGRPDDAVRVDRHADLVRFARTLAHGWVLARVVAELRPWSYARPAQRSGLVAALTEAGHHAEEGRRGGRMVLHLDGRRVTFGGTRNDRLVALEDRARRAPLVGPRGQVPLTYAMEPRDADALARQLEQLDDVVSTQRWTPQLRRRHHTRKDRLYLSLTWPGWAGDRSRPGPRAYVDLLDGHLVLDGTYDVLQKRQVTAAMRAIVATWWHSGEDT